LANVTDPDSRMMYNRKGRFQGDNAQAVTTCGQLVVAAELTQQTNDLLQLQPMLEAIDATLAAAGITDRPEMVLADCGYWSIANLTKTPDGLELLIPPAKHARQGKPRKDGKPSASKSDGLRAAMTAKLTATTARPATRCASRPWSRCSGRSRRSVALGGSCARGLEACEAEWKLMCRTHNLLKLWRYQAAQALVAPAIG
jgi:hypothetical protein